MSQKDRRKRSGTMGWLVVAGIATLLAIAVAPAMAGSANAAAPAPATGSNQWAYGGQANATGSLTVNGNSVAWDATLGWTVIFTATNTSNSTVQLEEQRTVGVDFTTTFTSPTVSATYTYHGTESDVAFVNLTDAATVTVNGAAVPALGIANESLSLQAAVDQSIHATIAGHSKSGWLNVSGTAQGAVSFAPALGIVPLNLTGVQTWNSTATSSPAVSWNIHYAWNDQGWNGSSAAGTGAANGNWSTSGPVNLTGYRLSVGNAFNDHQTRTAILLIVQGPVDAYDGYILVPHNFDLFGGSAHGFDAASLGSASIATGSAETLYTSTTPRGPMVTMADTSFAGSATADSSLTQPLAVVGSAIAPSSAPAGPGVAVDGEPMTVPAAQAETACLTNGCSAASSSTVGSLLGVAAIALAVVAVVGTVAVIEWRSYSRRRSQKGLVGGYGESWTNGVPPPSAQAPAAPASAPLGPEGPRTPP
jgi:hypothetical protein